MERSEIIAKVRWLIDDWCEVRNLDALRQILAVYPLTGDDPAAWRRLRDTLQHIQQAEGAFGLSGNAAALSELIGAAEHRAAH